MISVSNNVMSSLSARNRFWKLKATITRNNANAYPVDISDRVIASDIDFDWERRNGSASLDLDNYDYSLSPLNRSSLSNQVAGVFDPILDSNHILEIWEGILTVDGYEYVKRFTGVLGDEIDSDTYPGTVQITVRDKSKLVQDTYIYQSKTYGVVSGQPLPIAEKVIQDLLDVFLPNEKIILSVDSPTNFVVGKPGSPYTAKDVNLWDAIQQISDAFNFSIMFDEDGILRMKNIVRDLSKVTPVHEFNETQLVKDRLSTSDSDVRNHVKLRVQGLDPIEKKNQASIDKYGRRYFEIHRSLANLISTAEQAHALIDNIMQDLNYVVPMDRIEMALFPIIQVGDVVTLVNSRQGVDASTYRYRVSAVRDTFEKDKKRTSATLSGYSVYDPATVPAPKPVTNIGSSRITRAIQNYTNSGWVGLTKSSYYTRLTWTPPAYDVSNNALTAGFGGYTIYRKGVGDTGFYPVANIKSYIQPLNLVVDYWYDYTAIPGVNEYKIVAVNSVGKVSTEVHVTATKPADLII